MTGKKERAEKYGNYTLHVNAISYLTRVPNTLLRTEADSPFQGLLGGR